MCVFASIIAFVDAGLLCDPPFGNDVASQQNKARYEEWLYQHQALLQVAVSGALSWWNSLECSVFDKR